MNRKPDIPNPDKGKKPNREKSFTKARSFLQSEVLKIPIKEAILDYLRTNEEPIGYFDLANELGRMQTSLHRPMKELEKADRVAYIMGKNGISGRWVKKYFLLNEKTRIQLTLFNDGTSQIR